MPIADFVHLKVRSAYSLTEGANKVDKVVALAKENAMPAVAVTDRNNLFGALEFSQYAARAGIQPIVGCDLAIRREEEGGIATAGKLPATDWLTLLVQSERGYLNLMRLVSRAHLEFKTGSTAALPLDDLVGYTDGLLAFTGSAGSMLGRLLGGGQGGTAEHHLERLQRMFDGRLYLEVQRHGEDNERRIEGPLLDLAYARGLPIDRDQVGLAGLARTEHADAHASSGGAGELATLVTNLLQLADQRRGLLRHGRRLGRGVLQPADTLARGDGKRLAVLGQFEIDGVHTRFQPVLSMPVSSQ